MLPHLGQACRTGFPAPRAGPETRPSPGNQKVRLLSSRILAPGAEPSDQARQTKPLAVSPPASPRETFVSPSRSKMGVLVFAVPGPKLHRRRVRGVSFSTVPGLGRVQPAAATARLSSATDRFLLSLTRRAVHSTLPAVRSPSRPGSRLDAWDGRALADGVDTCFVLMLLSFPFFPTRGQVSEGECIIRSHQTIPTPVSLPDSLLPSWGSWSKPGPRAVTHNSGC